MLRSTLITFAAGWLIWLWIDKTPFALGPLPPPLDGEYLANFQTTVDLIRSGRFKAAYVYIWKAHYLLLSLAGGLIVAMISQSVSRVLSRRKLARLYIPQTDRGRTAGDNKRKQDTDSE